MIRSGIGYDSHRLEKGRRLVLGGVEVPHDCGLIGHSDADALCHAISDALLGAVADGDIGMHFPDTDPRWKDADSLRLLAQVGKRVAVADAVICNVDATIMAEEPKMAPWIDSMKQNVADALALRSDQVSVKATTMEGMGSIGHGEGIAAMAIATVMQKDSK